MHLKIASFSWQYILFSPGAIGPFTKTPETRIKLMYFVQDKNRKRDIRENQGL